jgi:hypothetical protein
LSAQDRNTAHHQAVAVAEAARQTSKAANNTAAGHKAADIAYYKAVLVSGRANGIKTDAVAALLSLGVDPGGLMAGDA